MVGPKGFYVDGRVKLSWFDSDLEWNILGSRARGNKGDGQAFSLELGKQTPIGGYPPHAPLYRDEPQLRMARRCRGRCVGNADREPRPRDHRLSGELSLGDSYNWGDDRLTLYTELLGDTAIADFGVGYNVKGTAGFRVRF